MRGADIISLVAIVAMSGWAITVGILLAVLRDYRRIQRELTALHEQLGHRLRRQRQFVAPRAFGDLQWIANWFDRGMQLSSEAVAIYRWPVNAPTDEKYQSLVNSFVKACEEWSAVKSQLADLALQYDPTYPSPDVWEWGAEPLPNDLPQLIEAFWGEVAERVKELSDRSQARRLPRLDLFSLHRSGLIAVKRLRRHMVAQMKHAAT